MHELAGPAARNTIDEVQLPEPGVELVRRRDGAKGLVGNGHSLLLVGWRRREARTRSCSAGHEDEKRDIAGEPKQARARPRHPAGMKSAAPGLVGTFIPAG